MLDFDEFLKVMENVQENRDSWTFPYDPSCPLCISLNHSNPSSPLMSTTWSTASPPSISRPPQQTERLVGVAWAPGLSRLCSVGPRMPRCCCSPKPGEQGWDVKFTAHLH